MEPHGSHSQIFLPLRVDHFLKRMPALASDLMVV